MKIGLQTWGSDGDINPFLALAAGLAGSGHTVTLAVTSAERKDYAGYAQRLGFGLVQVGYIGRDTDELSRLGHKILDTTNPLKQTRVILEELFDPGVNSMYEAARSLCSEHDVLIGHFMLHPLQCAAEKAGKPYVTVALNHGTIPTHTTPPPSIPNLGTWLNRLMWKIAEYILNRMVLPSINRLRLAEGLPPAFTFRDIWESPLCNLIAVSPEFCAPKPDWGENQQICGFLRLPDNSVPWTMPESLSEFLANGAPPVYMTFGSMLGVESDPEHITKTTHLLIDAAKQADIRAIIQSRWDIVTGIPPHADIYRIIEAPHTIIFPHCAAVVHHGGAGTTQTATLCGCPSVVVAHISDQFFWGAELKRLGVASKRLDRQSVTAEKLAREIRFLLNSSVITERAKNFGAKISAEHSTRRAIDILEQIGASLGIK